MRSSLLPFLLVVFLVTQNAPDVDHSPLVFDGCDQPASVVPDIEYHETPDHVRVFPTVPNVGEALPIRVAGNLEPGIQGCTPFAVAGGRFPNRLSADHPHRSSSQFAKFLSRRITELGAIAPHALCETG